LARTPPQLPRAALAPTDTAPGPRTHRSDPLRALKRTGRPEGPAHHDCRPTPTPDVTAIIRVRVKQLAVVTIDGEIAYESPFPINRVSRWHHAQRNDLVRIPACQDRNDHLADNQPAKTAERCPGGQELVRRLTISPNGMRPPATMPKPIGHGTRRVTRQRRPRTVSWPALRRGHTERPQSEHRPHRLSDRCSPARPRADKVPHNDVPEDASERFVETHSRQLRNAAFGGG
jgi:hypothetical protein